MPTSSSRAYEQFWGLLMTRIHTDHPDWTTPASPPPRNSLYLNTQISWFSYGTSFGRDALCSELYIRVPGDATAAERILSYLRSRQAELEAAYGRSLRYQDPSQMERSYQACRVAEYRSGSVQDAGEHRTYIDWFLDSQARLRRAVDTLGGLSALRDQATAS
jgi:hypothetical protein